MLVADDVELTVAEIDREIKRAYPEVKRVFIEAEARSMRAVRG